MQFKILFYLFNIANEGFVVYNQYHFVIIIDICLSIYIVFKNSGFSALMSETCLTQNSFLKTDN